MSDAPAPPPDAYLDTSTLVSAMIVGSQHSFSARLHATELVVARTSVYFSQIVRVEVSQALFRLATSPTRLPQDVREQFRLDRWDTDFLTRHHCMTHGIQRFEELVNSFAEVFEIPVSLDLWQRSVSIVSHYRLRSIDAVHVATAQSLGVQNLYTGDAAFQRVDGLNVILVRDMQ